MRLISDDGWFDIPYDNTALFVQDLKDRPDEYTILAKYNERYYNMAYYSSEAKARVVMSQIREYAKRHEDIYILPDDENELLNKVVKGEIKV